MERHRHLDSSMSSLYSGSNISNATPSRQHETFNYPTMSSSASPTPSALMHSAHANANTTADTTGSNISNAADANPNADANAIGSSTTPALRAITIGTVVVRCGPIQLVIALLQSPEKIYIKVVELEPKITTLGENLDESLHMQRDHDETLRNVQNLPGPMDEFVQKADKLLASKRISSELVNAMADTLNIIWQDILNLLHDRQHILHLCTQFHDKMTQCQRRMDQLEVACIDTMLPIEVTAVQEFLNKFKQLRIDMLTAVMAALKDGNELLAQLQDFEKMETLDTRPEHIKRDATRAVHQVQQWLEALHDRRNALEIAWQTRKTQLEQCLALAMLGRELHDLEIALQQQRNEVNTLFSLGECEHTANNALHNYRDWKQQALVLRDRALKITRAKEKLQSSGTFSGDEACAKAYSVLSQCTEHLDLVDQREHWLQQSRDFFGKAEKTLAVLEKLEVELSNVKLPPNSAESFAMYSKVARDVRNFTEEPLRLGYSILDDVGRTQPETQGVKRVLDETENRKVYIEGICSASNDDHQRVQQALHEFLQQYNDLLEWLRSSGQMYLQQHVAMGRNLQESKQFLLQHHELMQDLEIKGELINLLLESIKAHLESLSPQQRYDVDSKAEALHKHWIELKDLVLRRVDCVSVLIEFYEKANQLAAEWDNLQQQLLQTPDEQKLELLQSNWSNIRSEFNELKNRANRFNNMKIVDPYLEIKSSADAIDEILSGFSKRQIDVTTSLENWTTHIAEKHEVEVILEKIMSDNEETAARTTKVDTQLYPVFTSPSVDAKYLQHSTNEKLQLVLQDIDQAQDEIQQRVHTTLSIQIKDTASQQKIEQVIANLRTLKAKLDGIKYDYRTLLESILLFLENIIELRHEIDENFAKQKQIQTDHEHGRPPAVGNAIERLMIEHDKFRDACMDKFRSLITQSELLIDRVRALEPPGAREIDTDRILKLLENLRVHFEAGISERMSMLERLDKLEQFKGELCDINRSLDSVCKQLHEINGQSVDSLAAAKTTSLAFEYFERTIELLEKRIDKFTESTTQQLLLTNPESEAFVRDELKKLNEKWQEFKDQVKNKRKQLNQATEFFEMVEKIDAEYREITYFYNSISNKITYLRDPIEAANLVNDIEKYISNREGPLREKLENAARCSHDMNRVSQLYNDVMSIFQSFIKLKSDINVVEDRLKNEERQREQREREAREQAEREKAQREAEAREREAEARERAAREEAARLEALREQTARELAARELVLREEEARLQAVREQAAREQAAREQAAREEEARLRSLREEEARLLAQREQASREQEARLQAAREQVVREEAERLRALREEEAKLYAQREQAQREQEARLQAAREQAAREDEARLRALREEEARLQTLREQTKRDEETRLQALREQTKRDSEQHLKIVHDHVDHQRTITENIRKDIQVNQIFTELKYSSPQFTRLLSDAITREGEKITFECEVTGMPEPSVEWFKDGISIQNNPDYKTTYDKGLCRLVIEETFAADSARFCCRASNLVGAIDTCASLSVRENAAEVQMIPPRFQRQLTSAKATEGTTFEFSCAVTGNPLPTVQWFKNDKFIDDSPDYIINYNNGVATLRFEEVFLEDDAVYTCRATNPAGVEHSTASLMVEPLEPTEMPHFKIPLSNAMARVGQKVKIEALIGGIPRPDIFWMHNGKPYSPREAKYEYGRVTLVIPQAFPNDAGVYVLTAKNLAGEAYSSCNIIVKGRLPNETSDSEMASDMEPIKPSVQLPLKDVSIFEGKSVRLDCVIVGQPEPEVIWYHNERPIKESADVQLLFQGDRCSLIIQEVYQEDAGNYKVVAINSAGETSSQCELMVTSLNVAEPATRAHSERQSMPLEMLPKFEKLLTDVLVDEGETVELKAIASGDQPLTAKWYLTNKELQPNERISMTADAETGLFKLTIRSVNAEDRGVYTVKVSNNAGEAKCFSHLVTKSVNVPEHQQHATTTVDIVEKHTCPEFKEVFGDKNAHIDDVVKFECIVRGKPTPKVHWYFNDQPVHGHNFLVSTSGERQVLTIQQACTATTGKISCVAENEVGKATCVAFLNLIGSGMQPLPATSEQQSITQEHNTESSRVTIKQQTFTTTSTSQVNSYEGNMPPQTEVHHSSAHIDQSLKQLGAGQRPEIVESHHYQELHKSKDMSSPSVQQKSFVLIQSATQALPAGVPGSPTRLRKEIAPRFTTPLTGKIVDQGANVSMEAIYDGFPSPEIKVEKNGETLFDNEHTKIVNKCNRLTIDLKSVATTDAGRYAVTATNTMGQSTSTADLVVKKTIFPPVFGRRLQAQVVKKGEKIIMEVEVTGLPEPTVTWMKDEKPLKEAGLSEHRLLAQGNSYRLIIEKAQTSDSGKFMVKATNAGGEAKSIADCAILEPTPERMQEVVKTIVYETPTEINTENFNKEPLSFETNQTELSTTATQAANLHGLSESKIITEHRCTTEATMRLEHKSAHIDLPELSPRPRTPTTTNTITDTNTHATITTSNSSATTASSTITPASNTITLPNMPITSPMPTISEYDTIDMPQTKTVSFSTDLASVKKIPPQVPPKPTPSTSIAPPFMPSSIPAIVQTNGVLPSFSSSPTPAESNNSENQLTSSSFEFFKKMESSSTAEPHADTYKRYEDLPRLTPAREQPKSSLSQNQLADELRGLNLEPGTPPEICYEPKLEQFPRHTIINEKIQKLEDFQRQAQEQAPPQGGIATLPPAMQAVAYKHETTMSKEVKIEYGQPVIRPAANIQTLAAPTAQRSPSPKPSAEGIAMSKLWTPTPHVSGYESCTSDYENNRTESETEQLKTTKAERELKIPKLSTPIPELSAPFLVKQASKSLTIPSASATKPLRTLDDIQLVPGTPPEICYAPKPEGPKKVLPLSVPTLTPPQTDMPKKLSYRPPPPVMPAKLGRGDTYESDYESDRWKLSGSESDEASFRRPKMNMDGNMSNAGTMPNVPQQQMCAPPFKTSGYAADTEEISSYQKMQTSMQESRESRMFYESSTGAHRPQAQPQPLTTSLNSQPQPQQYQSNQQPQLKTQTPAQMYFEPTQNIPATMKQEAYSSSKEYKHEEKDYKSTMSMSSNISYNMSATGPKYQSTPIKPQAVASPVPMQRKTPAEFSDYSSEIDERFRSVSRQYESDSEIKGYRVVFPPTPTPRATSITNGHKSPVVVVTPSPMEFEPTPSPITTFARPKFEPIKKEYSHQIKTETMQQKQQQQQYNQQQHQQQPVYKPKPVAAKFLAATQRQQQQQPQQQQPHFQQERSKPTLYYNAVAGQPLHMAKTATETKNVMQMKESSETCERIVNMQQTKRVIHFDNQKQHEEHATIQQPTPEPFSYRPSASPSRLTPARQTNLPPPGTPTKFIPGEMRETDYESEVENAKIRPLWTPNGEYIQGGPFGYRHVEPPQPNRACSVPRTYGTRVLSPMEFDRGPEMPQKIQVDIDSLRRERRSSTSNLPNKTQTLGRHSSLRSTSASTRTHAPLPTTQFNTTVYEQQRQQHQQQQQNFARDDMNLKVGSPPKYGYIQAQADAQAKCLGSTFLQKSQQFIDDITSDFQKKSTKTTSSTMSSSTTKTSRKLFEQNSAATEPKYVTPTVAGIRPGFKRAPSEGDNRPQAYRDESRVSQYGTKCIDPDTGLIYFKYDFGYEFGILFPGEGRKFIGGQWNKSTSSSLPQSTTPGQLNGINAERQETGRKSPYPLRLPVGSDLVIPVRHERSNSAASTTLTAPPPPPNTTSLHTTFMPQYTNGYESDVAMRRSRSPAAAASTARHHVNSLKKRYSLPNTRNIDINIDALHANDPLLVKLPHMRSVPDLPADVPVNAHINRDDQQKKSPMFITPLKEIAVAAGGTARFECIVQAHPQPNIVWTRNENELQHSNKFLIEYRNGVCRLTIPQAYPDDAGVYACNAMNPLGAATTSGQLQVSCNKRGFKY